MTEIDKIVEACTGQTIQAGRNHIVLSTSTWRCLKCGQATTSSGVPAESNSICTDCQDVPEPDIVRGGQGRSAEETSHGGAFLMAMVIVGVLVGLAYLARHALGAML